MIPAAGNPAPPPDAVRAAARAWLAAHAAPGADLCADSRRLSAGDVFVALPGRRHDALRFLDEARRRGAVAALADEAAWQAHAAAAPLPVLGLPQLATAIAWIAADHYGDPTGRLRSIGITGTNGKTSSCIWTARVLGACGLRCATIGTLGQGFPEQIDAAGSTLTTPDAVDLQRYARRALDAGAQALAAEVSSIGLAQGRAAACHYHVALFTNLTRDHLDFHRDMADYGAAKRRLFLWPGLEAAVLNTDDDFGLELARELAAQRAGPRVIGVGRRAQAEPGLAGALWAALWAEQLVHTPRGLQFRVQLRDGAGIRHWPLATALLGDFNVANLLGVLGVALACGIEPEAALAAARDLQAPPGRLQRVAAPRGADGAPMAVVDYAHTPDAIAQALRALRPLAAARGGRLCIVFGAGGERDPGKRAPMAAAAAAQAERIVLTSDNPRGEDAEAIIDQLAAGLPAGASAAREADRGRAIALALAQAGPRDVVLIAGKGHEPYQEIAGQRLPFSDVEVAQRALQQLAGDRS